MTVETISFPSNLKARLFAQRHVRESEGAQPRRAPRRTAFPEAAQAGLVKIDGDVGKLTELLGMLDTFNPMFKIVEPRRSAQP